jgi:hypothetical protein
MMNKKMTREEINELTKEEWRELGFFYDQDKSARCWRLVGSRSGLLNFCTLLDDYAANERNATLSEHDHYGPYWYLKIVTWSEPLISEDDVRGTLVDLKRLSALTKERLENVNPGDVFEIDKEYSEKNDFKLRFEVRDDGFDPADEDPLEYPDTRDNRSLVSRVWEKLFSS